MDTALVAITALSIATAAAMCAVAWRLIREERRRSEARTAALAAAIHGAPREPQPDDDTQSGPGTRVGAVVGAGAAAALVVTAAALAFGGGATERPAVAESRPITPLELVALQHQRSDDETLVVRGVVRNSNAAPQGLPLAAVVLVFGADGDLIATERVDLSSAELAPGAEAQFAVTLPNAGAIARYRVSFRSEGRIVPHVDRRRRT